MRPVGTVSSRILYMALHGSLFSLVRPSQFYVQIFESRRGHITEISLYFIKKLSIMSFFLKSLLPDLHLRRGKKYNKQTNKLRNVVNLMFQMPLRSRRTSFSVNGSAFAAVIPARKPLRTSRGSKMRTS